MSEALILPPESRYKDTAAYSDGERVEFALWVPPQEFTKPERGWRSHRVRQNEVGNLDMIAVQYYGNGYEAFWWAIAQANAIIDPETEMNPGMVLYIPPRSAVTQFRSRSGRVSNG